MHKCRRTFNVNPKKLRLAYNLLNMNTQPTTNPFDKKIFLSIYDKNDKNDQNLIQMYPLFRPYRDRISKRQISWHYCGRRTIF